MKFTVIVIDDEEPIQKIMSDLVESMGLKLLGIGADGKDALKLFSMVKPDIVFLDLRMPDYDGYYALEEIKKIDPDAIIVLLSAESREIVEHNLKEHQPHVIISKPFSIKTLQETITSITSNNGNLISIAIKKTLNGIDNKILPLVQNKLSKDYHCKLSDCLENPEYLSRILKDIYGNSYTTILESIKLNLNDLVEDTTLSKFILELSK